MTSSFKVRKRFFFKIGRIRVMSLNELGEKSQGTINLSKFVSQA